MKFRIKHYLTANGVDRYAAWLASIQDQLGKGRIQRRVAQLEGFRHWGDCGRIKKIVELKVDSGPGYRVYCAQDGESVVLLLGGGDKSTQRGDIKKAQQCWEDYLIRKSTRR